MRRTVLAAAMAVFSAVSAAADDRIADAIEADDPFALEAALKGPGLAPAEGALLSGAMAAIRFDDEAAMADLGRGIAALPLSPRARLLALSLLGGVQLRAGAYAAAARSLDGALAIAEPSQTERQRQSLKQTRDVAFALHSELPQIHEPPHEGAAAITRDRANLARATGQVNGMPQEFVLDTGAGYSTITRSKASALKVRLLEDQITVGSATSRAVPAQLGIADEVEIAGNRFRHVVFLVMADEMLSFGNGAYSIDAILGFPVLSRLGRIEFARVGGGEVFRVVQSAGPSRRGVHDLYLNTLRPMVVLDMPGVGRLRMLLDTGARRSSLTGLFAATYPNAMTGAGHEKATFGGAGAMQTIDVRVLSNVRFGADGRTRPIDKITVSNETGREHGAVGQDLLNIEGGFALDFAAMDFAFLPGR